jgi:hypothetical protein
MVELPVLSPALPATWLSYLRLPDALVLFVEFYLFDYPFLGRFHGIITIMDKVK